LKIDIGEKVMKNFVFVVALMVVGVFIESDGKLRKFWREILNKKIRFFEFSFFY
jgi:hypothetical protein